jgi:protein-S-isoprenylcysteine O-methyltransferase Ste14
MVIIARILCVMMMIEDATSYRSSALLCRRLFLGTTTCTTSFCRVGCPKRHSSYDATVPLYMKTNESENRMSGGDAYSMMNRVTSTNANNDNSKSLLNVFSLSKAPSGTVSTSRSISSAIAATTSTSSTKMEGKVEKGISVLFDISALSKCIIGVTNNALKGEVGSRGEEYFVAQVTIFVLILFGNIPILGDTLLTITGPVLLLMGVAMIGSSIVTLGTSKVLSPWVVPLDNPDTHLVQSGLYRHVRHPMYSGLILLCLGIGIVTDSASRLLLTAILIYILQKQSIVEEQQLVQRYEKDYLNYQNDVSGKFFPNEFLDFLPWNKQD